MISVYEVQKEQERLTRISGYRIIPTINFQYGTHTYTLQKKEEYSALYGAYHWVTVFEYNSRQSAEMALQHLLSE